MLSADWRPWNWASRAPSSGRIGRIDAVDPSARTTVVSHSAGYPSGVGAAMGPACRTGATDGRPVETSDIPDSAGGNTSSGGGEGSITTT